MKFFRRKSLKSGYCNISEPVSDLDPARISEIKARHSKLSQKDKHRSIPSNDDTFITENITLETSPSAVASLSGASSSKSFGEKKLLPDLQEASSRAEETEVKTAPLLPDTSESGEEGGEGEAQFTAAPSLKHAPKTPDTFFGGKNRKRIPIKMDSTSQAPTEHPIAASAMGDGEREEEAKIVHVPKMTARKIPHEAAAVGADSQSQSSDLDKSFSPQIISVNSDITDPFAESSYVNPRRKKKGSSSHQQPSWKKLKKLRRYLQETINSRTGACSNNDNNNSSNGRSQKQQQNPLTVLDSLIDALCTYPGSKTNT